MSKSSNEFLKERERLSSNFNGFKEFQEWKYGDVLPKPSRHPVFVDISNQEQDGNDNDYWNANIFSNQNPES